MAEKIAPIQMTISDSVGPQILADVSASVYSRTSDPGSRAYAYDVRPIPTRAHTCDEPLYKIGHLRERG